MRELSSANLVWLIPFLPLLGFFINAFIGKKLGKPGSGALATAAVFASFAVSVVVFLALLALPAEERRATAGLVPGGFDVPWISISNFEVRFNALIDPLSMLMCLIITGIGGLIHLYSMGYMATDRDYPRFFTYLNLFIFFMLTLVLGGNLLLMFVGWEGVGLCSYLLISFWYEDMNNSRAGNKAFIVNRIGDVGFALGMMAIFFYFGTLTYYTPEGNGFLDQARQGITVGGTLTAAIATAIALLLFVGACGKSAQFPLYVWLPDAMAGPTPVSALIHAATMVTAGVVMISRVSPIVVVSEVAMVTIAAVGLFTAFFAATIALTQNDIKKVLAYSTVSQLGFMFLACGVGAFATGMFHVTTHAFFKALLFLGSGSVIHAMAGEQDMRRMGGLRKYIPVTFWTMAIGWFAISGFPGLAGFWSKDEILAKASAFPSYGLFFYAAGALTALLTAFYMSRLMWKTFFTNQRFNEAEIGAHGHAAHGSNDGHAGVDAHGHAVAHHAQDEATAEDAADLGHGGGHAHPAGVHESPPSMTIPLAVLAVLSLFGGLMGTPYNNMFEHFLEPSVAKPNLAMSHGIFPSHEVGLAVGAVIAVLGMGLAWMLYGKNRETGEIITPDNKRRNPLYQGSLNLWGYDNFTNWLGVRVGGLLAVFSAWFDRYIVDGIVNGVAALAGLFSEGFRRTQTGFIRSYALIMLGGVIVVLASLLWPLINH
jgi:NADH-quinone oxidoreductase subunit L